MKASELVTLLRYNRWANDRVLDAAATPPGDVLIDPGPASHGTIAGALAHVVGTEWTWRMRCQEGISPQAVPTAADFATLEALRERFASEAAAWLAFAASLSDTDVERAVRYTNTKGTPFETPLWQIVLHVVNHGTQFRAEAAVLLSAAGSSPGDLDLIAYLRSHAHS